MALFTKALPTIQQLLLRSSQPGITLVAHYTMANYILTTAETRFLICASMAVAFHALIYSSKTKTQA